MNWKEKYNKQRIKSDKLIMILKRKCKNFIYTFSQQSAKDLEKKMNDMKKENAEEKKKTTQLSEEVFFILKKG